MVSFRLHNDKINVFRMKIVESSSIAHLNADYTTEIVKRKMMASCINLIRIRLYMRVQLEALILVQGKNMLSVLRIH